MHLVKSLIELQTLIKLIKKCTVLAKHLQKDRQLTRKTREENPIEVTIGQILSVRNSEEKLQGDICSPTYYRYYHRENRNYPFEAEIPRNPNSIEKR